MEYLSDLHERAARQTTAELGKYFERSVHDAADISGSYEQLWQHVESVVMHGGKRIRPYLTVVGAGALDDSSLQKIIPFAAAQELLHSAMLMHDDIIDRDDIRHGRDNMNGLYKKLYSRIPEPDRTHYAYSAATLGGDLLIAGAHQLIASCEANQDDKLRALERMYQSIYEVVGGELMDVEASLPGNTELHALPIAMHKTASYSFVGPLITGAILAHASPEHLQKLTEFGQNLGTAFQLQDDLLGVFGDESITGKSTVNDIREGKHTYLIEQYRQSDGFDEELFSSVFRQPGVSNELIDSFKASLESSGARSATEAAVAQYVEASKQVLQTMPRTDPTRLELEVFSSKLMQRSY